MRIGTRMRTGRSGLDTARFRVVSAITVAVIVVWALACGPASVARAEAPGGRPSLVHEAEALFWLALSAAASWLLTLHLRRRWRQKPDRDLEPAPEDADDRPSERAEFENRRHASPASDPWQLDEAVGRLVAAANRLSAHADLIELTERLNDLAERMEKPLAAIELALAPGAERAGTTEAESEVPEITRPAAGARFAFVDSPAPLSSADAEVESPESSSGAHPEVSDDDALVGVEPRALSSSKSPRGFAQADSVPTPRATIPARPGREALEITALGIGDSEALESEA